MVEATSKSNGLQLGRRSISALINVLEAKYTNTQLNQLMFEQGLDERYSGPNILSRLGNVFHPIAKTDVDDNEMKAAIELIEMVAKDGWDAIDSADELWIDSSRSERAKETYDSLQQALRADGLDLVEGRIVPFVSPSVDISREQGLLESRLSQHGFEVAANHLEQAVDNAARSNWEASNSQIRSFLEALCDSIASKIYEDGGSAPTRGKARQYLGESGLLSPEESELLKSFFTMLHGQGGHAGTSSSDDCHRRRLMALAMANYYLDRLDDRGRVDQ